MDTKDFFLSRDVKFFEANFPFLDSIIENSEFEDTFEVMTNKEVKFSDNIMDTPHEITPSLETTSTSSPVPISNNHNLSPTTREESSISANSEPPNMGRAMRKKIPHKIS